MLNVQRKKCITSNIILIPFLMLLLKNIINEIKASINFSLFNFKCMDSNLKRENNLTIIFDSFNKYIKNIEKILFKYKMFELNKKIN